MNVCSVGAYERGEVRYRPVIAFLPLREPMQAASGQPVDVKEIHHPDDVFVDVLDGIKAQ
jgi:hypothetical protein